MSIDFSRNPAHAAAPPDASTADRRAVDQRPDRPRVYEEMSMNRTALRSATNDDDAATQSTKTPSRQTRLQPRVELRAALARNPLRRQASGSKAQWPTDDGADGAGACPGSSEAAPGRSEGGGNRLKRSGLGMADRGRRHERTPASAGCEARFARGGPGLAAPALNQASDRIRTPSRDPPECGSRVRVRLSVGTTQGVRPKGPAAEGDRLAGGTGSGPSWVRGAVGVPGSRAGKVAGPGGGGLGRVEGLVRRGVGLGSWGVGPGWVGAKGGWRGRGLNSRVGFGRWGRVVGAALFLRGAGPAAVGGQRPLGGDAVV